MSNLKIGTRLFVLSGLFSPCYLILTWITAIAVHADWRAKLKTAAARHEQLDFESIGRRRLLRIGKWLHGAGKSKHDGSPTFVDLIAKHKQFHQEASKVA